jgi:hypothetical protein
MEPADGARPPATAGDAEAPRVAGLWLRLARLVRTTETLPLACFLLPICEYMLSPAATRHSG